jgi:hypothetical protein
VHKFTLDNVSKVQQLLSNCDCILQPYVGSIVSRGELSLLYFDGVFSHAVHKVPPRYNKGKPKLAIFK